MHVGVWFIAMFLTRRAARDSPGIDNEFKYNIIFVNMPHRTHNCTNTLYVYAIINY